VQVKNVFFSYIIYFLILYLFKNKKKYIYKELFFGQEKYLVVYFLSTHTQMFFIFHIKKIKNYKIDLYLYFYTFLHTVN